eukprot:3796891-Amphidinium_carterae.1
MGTYEWLLQRRSVVGRYGFIENIVPKPAKLILPFRRIRLGRLLDESSGDELEVSLHVVLEGVRWRWGYF